ncbi:L-arabinose isomerase [Microbacterium tumbae]
MTGEKIYADREVWFLTGSVQLYGPETLAQVAAQSQVVAERLGDADDIPVRIVWKPVLTGSEGIRRAALEANSDDRVIGVIVWMHTFSPAKMWIAGLDALDKPLLHLHTQANIELPWATIDFDFMNLNQSAHGDREFAYIAARLDTSRTVVVGHVSDPVVTGEVATWTRAAAGRSAARSLRVMRFGDNMRDVAVTEGDKTEAQVRFGAQVNTWGVEDLTAAVAEVADAEADALVAEYADLYELVPELRRGGERHESLRYAARQEAALRHLLAQQGARAFTTTFEDLGGLRQLPGFAVQRLMADGFGFGPEGDWKTSILVHVAKVMGAGLPGGASLMEDYTYDLTPGEERILGSHMLEICSTLTTMRPKVEIHPLGIGSREDPVRMVFDAEPGQGVVVALTDMRDRFRFTVNAIDVVDPPEALPNLPVARAVWRPRPDFRTATTAWLHSGGAHHTVLSTQLGAAVWEEFGEMTRSEVLVIDERTTVPDFRRQLRWGSAYHRLARGI